MICQSCKKNDATVHVTDVTLDTATSKRSLADKHLCEPCAQAMNLPQMQVVHKGVADIWKLLQYSARKSREQSVSCPECGMTLAEFRSKGRLGCPHDYEIFRPHLDPLLQRIHSATRHTGRAPGGGDGVRKRQQSLTDLRAKLAEAIREEAYESAAKLRDEIQALEAGPSEA